MSLPKLARLLLIAGGLGSAATGAVVACGAGSRSGGSGLVLETAALLLVAHVALLTGLVWWLLALGRAHAARFAAVSEELGSALRREQDLIECSSDLIWEIDAAGRFTSVHDHNNVMGHDWGVRVGLTVGELAELDPVTPREVWMRQIESNLAGERFRDFHYCLRRPDGRIASFFVNGVPIRSEAGALVGFRGITRDRTNEVETLNLLRFQVSHDALTGLLNRRGLTTALDAAAVAGGRFAVLLLDLDGFKTINDVHGHAAGDQLLCFVAARLDRAKRLGDVACRLGGDEFAVILPDVDQGAAAEIACRLIDCLKAPFLLDQGTLAQVGVSIGIALVPSLAADSDMILRHADLALYQAKHNGGNGFSLYEEDRPYRLLDTSTVQPPGMTLLERFRSLAAMPGEPGRALEQGELSLLYQPICRSVDGSVAYRKALLRWNSATLGPVSPEIFIPLAEESGLIRPIGGSIFRQACQAAARPDADWSLVIDLAPAQFSQPDLVSMLAGILRETGLAPERLMLELTEQALVSPVRNASETIRRLRAMGVTLALVGVGSGFCGISHLRNLRFDLLSIDRSILRLDPEQKEPVLAALIEIARAFGVPTVVEGVEDADDLDLARRLGSQYVQGVHLGHPCALPSDPHPQGIAAAASA